MALLKKICQKISSALNIAICYHLMMTNFMILKFKFLVWFEVVTDRAWLRGPRKGGESREGFSADCFWQ